MRKARCVSDPERALRPLPRGAEEHQPGGDPGQSGQVEFGEGNGERQSREDCDPVTRSGRQGKVQPTQIAQNRDGQKLEKHLSRCAGASDLLSICGATA